MIALRGIQGNRQQPLLNLAPRLLVAFEHPKVLPQAPVGELQLVPVALILDQQVAPLQRPAHRVHQHFHVDNGFDQIVAGTEPQGGDHIAHHSSPGDHDYRQIRRVFVQSLEHLKTVQAGHSEVGNDQFRLVLAKHRQPGRAIGRLQHLKPAVFEIGHDTLADRRVVVDDQQFSARVGHLVVGPGAGKVMGCIRRNTLLPSPGRRKLFKRRFID